MITVGVRESADLNPKSAHTFMPAQEINPITYLPETLPRWLSWLKHSAHRPGRSVGGAGVQFPGSAGRFRVRIFKGRKEGSTVSSII